jgi:hypothetical protein
VFAAGIEPADDRADLAIVVLGFAIMRLAMVTQWLRAARFDPEHRTAALRYAGGSPHCKWGACCASEGFRPRAVSEWVFVSGSLSALASWLSGHQLVAYWPAPV